MSSPKKAKSQEDVLLKFKELFREARREHSKSGKRASAETPAHKAIVKFAAKEKIPGAQELLVALPVVWNEQDNQGALSLLESAEKDLPPILLGHVWNIKGLLLGNLKRWDDAIECHQKALETPGYDTPGKALYNMGSAYVGKREYDRAIECYQKALETPGFDTPGDALHNMGSAYANKRDYDRAIECYQKALETPGFDTPGMALNNMGSAYHNKREYDRAIDYYKKALETPGYDTPGKALHNMGSAYANKREYDRAIDYYKKALETAGYDTPGMVLNNLANSLRKLERYDEALEILNKVLSEPDREGEHERAISLRRLIEESKAGVKPSVAEEALARTSSKAEESAEKAMLAKLGRQEQGRKDKYDEYLVLEVPARQDGFTCLRGWSSAVTLLEGGEDCHWVGGGYFLRWQGKGIVIDPGFDFMDNFHDAKLHLKEVDAVLVSHNHSDHNYDLSSLDDLRYELHRRWRVLKTPEEKKKHDVSRCLFVLDEDTSQAFRSNNADHRGLPMKLSESDAQRKRWIERQNDLPLTIEHFKVEHGDDVPRAMGMRLRLHDDKTKKDFVFGYTGDTRWNPALEHELKDCDVLLAHISMPSDEELLDDAEYESKLERRSDQGGFQDLPKDGFKAVHLGYRGMIELISRTKPKMVLVGEFWAGLADLRIDLVKGLRAQVKRRTGMDIPILPTGLGFRLCLPSLEVECTSCNKPVPHSELKIAPAANPFGPLSYLCPGCLG